MENLVTKKKEYLLSIPDIVDVIKASETVAAWFIKSKKNKPEYQLENYVCFHKDFKYGVYLIEDKFHFVSIMRPKKFLGIESGFVIQVVSEILTDDLDDSHLEKGSITGATLLRRDTDSEKAFFKAVIEYDEVNLKEQSNKFQQELEQKIKDKEASERKDKQVKLKKVSEADDEEDQKPSKMEMIEALLNNMKEMDRNSLRAMYMKMSNDDEEEAERFEFLTSKHGKNVADAIKSMDLALTKAEIARDIVELMKKKEDGVEEGYLKLMKEAERKAKQEAEKFEFLTSKYGKNVADAYKSQKITLGMPISIVEEIKGQGYDRKRNISKQGETIKEKYGKYYKTLASGKKSSAASYEMEIEYERDESGNSWLVSSLKDL